MSGTPINLNKARKAAQRGAAKVRAQENVVKHGRTKAEREVEEARAAQVVRKLDQHKRDL